jgi:phenylpyruvate tautomerase PptA (4-oxalocrotonate tautomerase family)
MPLIKFDLIEGRSPQEITGLLEATHRALVSAFGIPESDRYQIVNEHPATHLIVQDTGLGIERTKDVVIISIISRPRSEASKVRFYEELCRELMSTCKIAPSDVVISIVTNTDADWSFGNGRAQFITGEL